MTRPVPLLSNPTVTLKGAKRSTAWCRPAGRWNGPADWTGAAFGGAALLSGGPSAAVSPDGSQLMFWQGAGGHLNEAWWAAGHRNGPVDWTIAAFAGQGLLAPAATVLSDGSQQLVFWRGAAGHLIEAWWAGGHWNGPVDLDGRRFRGAGQMGSGPAAVATPGGTQLVFWQGGGQSVWEAWWTGHWNGPADFGG